MSDLPPSTLEAMRQVKGFWRKDPDFFERVLQAALDEGGVVLATQSNPILHRMNRDLIDENHRLREAAKAFLDVAPISRGSTNIDYSDARARLSALLEQK